MEYNELLNEQNVSNPMHCDAISEFA